MRSKASVEIACPIEEVFRLTNEHVPEWSIVVVADEVLDEKPEGVGTTFRTVTEDHGRRMEFDGIVTRHEPPHTSAVRLTNSMLHIETEYLFESTQTGTRVTQEADVRARGLMRFPFFLMGIFMRKASCKSSEKELLSLKAFCEGKDEASGESRD